MYIKCTPHVHQMYNRVKLLDLGPVYVEIQVNWYSNTRIEQNYQGFVLGWTENDAEM